MSDEIKRNCNSCKSGIVAKCDMLKNNEEYQALWNPHRSDSMLDAYKYKENFICDEYKSRFIEYPIEVSKINKQTALYCLEENNIGKFVKITPCSKEYERKTYLGIFLGDLPIDITVSHNPDTKELNLRYLSNPAIFVFDLNKIIFGAESWWGIIKNEDELKEITQADIDNTWYVKALKAMNSKSEVLDS